MSSNNVPIVATIWLLCLLDKKQVIFWIKKSNFKDVKTNTKTVCHSRYFQAVNQASIILPRQILTSRVDLVPHFSRWYVGKQETFVNLCHINVPKKTRQPSKTITQVQFLTKYSNRLTDQPLSKHHTVNLDLDGLKKPRYPRMTKRATKRVWVLSLWCHQRQETFKNIATFQTTH